MPEEETDSSVDKDFVAPGTGEEEQVDLDNELIVPEEGPYAPGLTVKELRDAIQEGRVTELLDEYIAEQKPTIYFGGKPFAIDKGSLLLSWLTFRSGINLQRLDYSEGAKEKIEEVLGRKFDLLK